MHPQSRRVSRAARHALLLAQAAVLALASAVAVSAPARAAAPVVVAMDAGWAHTCAVLQGGAVRCWGFNSHGQLGDGSTETLGDDEIVGSVPPVRLPRPAIEVAAGDEHSCAILDDRSVRCWGNGQFGRLGYAAQQDIRSPAGIGPVDLGRGRTARQISAGSQFTCALLDDWSVRCWGSHYFYRLGTGQAEDIGDDETPGSVPPVDFGPGRSARQVVAGRDHACAILDDGSARCWGRNYDGELGIGNTEYGRYPAQIPAVRLGAGRRAMELSAGDAYGHSTCALLDDRSVRCWGANENGQLGIGSTMTLGDDETPDTVAPVALGPGGAVDIAVGGQHACAILTAGTLRCWGALVGFGTVGDDELPTSVPPVALGTGRAAVLVANAGSHTCVALDDGTVRCFGEAGAGRLGNGAGPLDLSEALTGEPRTWLTSAPANSKREIAIAFTSDTAGSGFECRVDGGPWATCVSPLRLTGLTSGRHQLDVRAVQGSLADRTPATHTWDVTVPAPETTITSGPADGNAGASRFAFTSDLAQVRFECRLDNAAWLPCASPKVYPDLGAGVHQFDVRAITPEGDTDGSPDVRVWKQNPLPPETRLSSAPAATSGPKVAFAFVGDRAARFECRVDSGAWGACTSPVSPTGLTSGRHSFAVRAVDAAGTADSTPVSYSWTVDATPPETKITATPIVSIGTRADVSFTASESGSRFECQVGATGPWRSCTSPSTFTSPKAGAYRLAVRATDRFGNTDLTPATTTWSTYSIPYSGVSVTAPGENGQGLRRLENPVLDLYLTGWCTPVIAYGVRGAGTSVADFHGLGRHIDDLSARLRAGMGDDVIGLAANPYPAASINPIDGSFVNLLNGTYDRSVLDGTIQAIYDLSLLTRNCPRSRVVVSGYSQGAHVVRQALPYLSPTVARAIASVVLIGDPAFRADEPQVDEIRVGDFDPAKQGVFVAGPFMRPTFDVEARYDGKLVVVCARGDFACQAGSVGPAHTSYAGSWLIKATAKKVEALLRRPVPIWP